MSSAWPDAGKYGSTAGLLELVRHAESDAWLSLGLAFYLNALPLSRQLSSLSGALWSRVLQVMHCRQQSLSHGSYAVNCCPTSAGALDCAQLMQRGSAVLLWQG